jgi:hypothetical protein
LNCFKPTSARWTATSSSRQRTAHGQIIGYVNSSVRVNEKVGVLLQQETYLAIAEQDGIKRFVVSTVTKDMDRILKFYRRYGFRPWFVELFI